MKLLTLLVILACQSASAHAAGDCKDERNYPLITSQELKAVVQKQDATIFDVNGAESYKNIHVPHAYRFGDHDKDFAKLLPADKNSLIIAYCGGPQCTAWLKAAKEACALGYTNVKHYRDGIEGWKKL